MVTLVALVEAVSFVNARKLSVGFFCLFFVLEIIVVLRLNEKLVVRVAAQHGILL